METKLKAVGKKKETLFQGSFTVSSEPEIHEGAVWIIFV